jgi:hypothetical protein
MDIGHATVEREGKLARAVAKAKAGIADLCNRGADVIVTLSAEDGIGPFLGHNPLMRIPLARRFTFFCPERPCTKHQRGPVGPSLICSLVVAGATQDTTT